MNDVTKLVNRKIKRNDAAFFDGMTDILRDEGYSNYWYDFRKKMHAIFDENEALQSKVEEMQKVIDTAVMFLQGNELFIKAEQIKLMSQALKGESR